MNNKILLLVFLFVFSCIQPEKPKKTTIVDRTTKKTVKIVNPTLDSFFENISEEQEFISEKDIEPQEAITIASKKSLKIAVVLPVTGAFQKLGSEGLDLTYFLEQRMGDKLQIKVFNTESKKNSMQSISRKISEEEFDVIIGPIFNFETIELANLQPSIPIISLSNDKEIKKPNVLVFGQNPDDQIKDIVTFFSQQEKRNFMAIFPNSPTGSRLYRVFKGSVGANKSEIMRVEFYDESGISDVSKYVSKITNGLVQKTYISKEDGTIISERKVRETLAKDPTTNLNSLYNIVEKKAQVLYVSASPNFLPKVLNILQQPSNQEKLKDIFIVIADFENMEVANIAKYNNFFFYANNYYKTRAFNQEFKAEMGYSPSRLTSLIYDAITYSIYVNNSVFGTLDFESLKTRTRGFEGTNGGFYFNGNVVRRTGKVVVIKNGAVLEIGVEDAKSERMRKMMRALDLKEDLNYAEINEDLD